MFDEALGDTRTERSIDDVTSSSKFERSPNLDRLTELGGFWFWIAQLYRLTPIRWVEDRPYRWVADHRSDLRFWSTTRSVISLA